MNNDKASVSPQGKREMDIKTIDNIANRLFKTDYKYIGLDVCKVQVLEEYILAGQPDELSKVSPQGKRKRYKFTEHGIYQSGGAYEAHIERNGKPFVTILSPSKESIRKTLKALNTPRP